MTSSIPENQPAPEAKKDTTQENIAAMRMKYERQLAMERAAREEAEKRANEATSRRSSSNDEEEDDEPYIDRKKLKRELSTFGERNKQETQSEIQRAVNTAIQEERKQTWIKQNPDFFEVLQHAEKLAMDDPDLADTILEMPDGFERQKLVYKTVKKLNLHKPAPAQASIQDKIDANRKSPYYRPAGPGAPPYASQGNFSEAGKKDAYQKMQELKNNLRI